MLSRLLGRFCFPLTKNSLPGHFLEYHQPQNLKYQANCKQLLRFSKTFKRQPAIPLSPLHSDSHPCIGVSCASCCRCCNISLRRAARDSSLWADAGCFQASRKINFCILTNQRRFLSGVRSRQSRHSHFFFLPSVHGWYKSFYSDS